MKGIIENFSVAELKELLSPLFGKEDLQLVLLFGSRASGTVHRKSDLDLAFLFERAVDIVDLTNRIIRILHTDQIDVVDLSRANPLLSFSVAKHGLVLYEKTPGTFTRFFSYAFRRFVDTEKLRKAQVQAVRLFLEEREGR